LHLQEWIAPATAMLLIAKLMNGYNSADVNVRYLVESIDWYITPVLNPDGFVPLNTSPLLFFFPHFLSSYEYSHTKANQMRLP
jgi:murein tripeptide amidase MpaA